MKRLLSILIAIALMATMSVTAFAAETAYDLWVAGEQITSENMDDVLGDGTVSFTPANGNTPATLTLNGANISVDDGETSGIKAEMDLTINLVGANRVTARQNDGVDAHAVLAESGSLTINGSGSLEATTEDGYGICADGNLTIESGTVTATGIYSYGDVAIEGGMVTSNGAADDTTGIYADGNLTITGGEVTATGGIYSCGISGVGITITSGTVTATGVIGTFADGNIDISGGKVEATGSSNGICAVGNIIINSGTLEATANDEYGIGIVANAVTVNGGTVEVISTGECGYGITTYYGVSCNGDFDVYAGETAPGELVTSPTTSTYNSKYVKIAPAEPEAETKSTTVTYQVDPTYTVTIPATVALGETATIKAENVVVAKGKQVEVTLTNANGFTVATPQGAELGYTVKNGETVVNEGDTVLIVNPDGGKTGETTLTFTTPETVKFAGDYTGTVTFTIAVNPAVNN